MERLLHHLIRRRLIGIVGLGIVLAPWAALAWGASGHRMIGELAAESLPDGLPSFLKTPDIVAAIGETSREPDRWRDSGRTHDTDHDPAHFLDLGDDGKVLGGPELSALPPTRAGYEAALEAVGAQSWKAGYLPYAIIDGYQQLAKDFAYWRVETAALEKVANPAHRAWMTADRKTREAIIVRDLGVLSHYVGDGSQPLHVTVHYNGWGAYPNPQGYTTDRIHIPFEGPFVFLHVTKAMVRGDMTPAQAPTTPIAAWTSAYLAHTASEVVPLYDLYKSGGFSAHPTHGEAFAAARLAEGASALRDLIIGAWRDSRDDEVGYPGVSLASVTAQGLDPYDSLYGQD